MCYPALIFEKYNMAFWSPHILNWEVKVRNEKYDDQVMGDYFNIKSPITLILII